MAEPINSTISPWMPEQDQIRLAVLGKLIEECNELAHRAARCIIQGIDQFDPASGRQNKVELEREIADVFACIEMAEMKLNLISMHQRATDKIDGFDRWHRMIIDGASPLLDTTLSSGDLQLLMRLKADNTYNGPRHVIESGFDPCMRLSDRGLIALEQHAKGVIPHITRKGVKAVASFLESAALGTSGSAA